MLFSSGTRQATGAGRSAGSAPTSPSSAVACSWRSCWCRWCWGWRCRRRARRRWWPWPPPLPLPLPSLPPGSRTLTCRKLSTVYELMKLTLFIFLEVKEIDSRFNPVESSPSGLCVMLDILFIYLSYVALPIDNFAKKKLIELVSLIN